MEAAEHTFLDAMKKARIKGALVGVEAVTAGGLKSVYKDFNLSGDNLVKRLKTFSDHGVHVFFGSFIFGLPSDRRICSTPHWQGLRQVRRRLDPMSPLGNSPEESGRMRAAPYRRWLDHA